MDENKKTIIDILKLFSGRVAITLVVCVSIVLIVNCFCTLLAAKQADISVENLQNMYNTFILIISNVVTFYFTKKSNDDS